MRYCQTYTVSCFMVNAQQRLSLFGLLNLLQDTAWQHADELGHGFQATQAHGQAWVMTRQFLNISGVWPSWGSQVTVHTWLRPAQHSFVTRDFEVWSEGKLVGSASTGFVTMDLTHRKAASFELPPHIFAIDGHLKRSPEKILPIDQAQPLARFQVRNSDLDLLGHVNNTRYAQWITDALPWDDLVSHRLNDYEINFLSETRPGDEVEVQAGPTGNGEQQFQGVRTRDQRVVFSARVRAEKLLAQVS